MLLPFYRISRDAWIEAYLIARVDPLAKVTLIKSIKARGSERGDLEPVPYDTIKEIIRNDIRWIEDALADMEGGTRLSLKDYFLIPLFNPGQYMFKINLSLLNVVTLRITKSIYERLLERMPEKPLELRWFNIEVKDGKIFLEGAYDEGFTNTYTYNDSLKQALTALLKSGQESTKNT